MNIVLKSLVYLEKGIEPKSTDRKANALISSHCAGLFLLCYINCFALIDDKKVDY